MQLQTPDLDLSELPEEIPIDSLVPCRNWSSGTTVSWCCTQALLAEQAEGRTPLPTSVFQGRGFACLALPPCTGQKGSSFYLV